MVLGGVIVPEGAWHHLSTDFSKLKQKYEITGEVKWKFFGTGNKKAGNSLAHLDRALIDDFRSEVFSLLTARKSIKIIVCVASVEAAYQLPSIRDQDDIYHLVYKGLTERFQYFLQDAGRTVGQKQLGVVVCDHRMSADDVRLREKHHRLVENDGGFTSTYDNFVETVFFAPSHVSVGIQLADMVAGAVHRSYQYGDHRHARAISPAFRKSPAGRIKGYGLVKMPDRTFILPSGGEA